MECPLYILGQGLSIHLLHTAHWQPSLTHGAPHPTELCLGHGHRQRGTYTSSGTTTAGRAQRSRDKGTNDDPPYSACQKDRVVPTTSSHVHAAGYTTSSGIAQSPPMTPRPVRHRQPPRGYGQFAQY